MKRIFLSIACILTLVGAKADEGMWTLYNLPEAVYKQMQAEGFTMDYKDLYESKNAIKNCVVNFSGYCSGVVVSPNGLVFTNHHCGFESIRSHSSVEHDYMLHGFIANSYEEELPNENMFVSFMYDQKDITDELTALAKKKGVADSDWDALIDSVQNAMSDEVKKRDSTLHVEIDAFFEGNKRAALLTCELLLDGLLIDADTESVYRMVLDVACGRMEPESITAWLKDNTSLSEE